MNLHRLFHEPTTASFVHTQKKSTCLIFVWPYYRPIIPLYSCETPSYLLFIP